jgi:hypothetical protein
VDSWVFILFFGLLINITIICFYCSNCSSFALGGFSVGSFGQLFSLSLLFYKTHELFLYFPCPSPCTSISPRSLVTFIGEQHLETNI